MRKILLPRIVPDQAGRRRALPARNSSWGRPPWFSIWTLKGSLAAALAAALAWGGTARAQEALYSAIMLDRIVQPATNGPVPAGHSVPHLGPVQFTFGSTASVAYDDNVNLTASSPQADMILSAGLSARLAWPVTPQSELDLNAGIGYTRYLANSSLSHWDIAPDSALTWSVMFEDGSLTFFDNFSFTQEVVSEAALSGTGQLPRYDNTIGTRASWLPGQWLVQAGYSHDNYFSDDPAFSYLNRASEYFFARGAWRFAESTQAGVEASVGVTKYDLPIQNDNTSYSFGPYADWQVTKNLHASIRGGPTIYQFDSTGQSGQGGGLNSYYLGLDVTHQLAAFLSHHVGVQRNVQPGLTQGSDYIEQLSAWYDISWAMTPHFTVLANVSYEHGTQPLQNLGIIVKEDYDRVGVGPGLAWQITGKLSSSLAYWHRERQSNLDGHGYIENNITWRVDYRF
jgi:hypothetical protein